MSERTPSVIYYGIIVAMLLSSLFAMKLPMGKGLKMALGWVVIFAVVFVLFALWKGVR